jgi:hypothetical protein
MKPNDSQPKAAMAKVEGSGTVSAATTSNPLSY